MRNPTYTHYMSDGNGRDSYILINNGGLTISRVNQPDSTNDYFNCSVKKGLVKHDSAFYGSNRSLAKDPPPFYYPPDGTGRDFYIIKNNGGLINNHQSSLHHNFHKELRYSNILFYE